jgi:hypothetical protein
MRFACLLAPWKLHEYPGYRRLVAEVLGVAESYAKRLVDPCGQLPAHHAQRMSAIVRERAAAHLALAEELDRYAEEHAGRAKRPRGFMKDRGKAVGG